MISTTVSLYIQDKHRTLEAQILANRLSLDLVETLPTHQEVLVLTTDRLELQLANKKLQPIYVDFETASMQQRLQKSHGRSELIARAVGIKGAYRPTIIDATAGLGYDSVILANLGCEVDMVERSPVVFALLEDGLKRAKHREFEWVSRLSLTFEDARHFLQRRIDQNNLVDVVYLDPMFPDRLKSALVKKEMRILKQIVGKDTDADQIYQLAKQCAKKRVVIKRPTLAGPLTSELPTISYPAKVCRFDVLMIP